MKKLLLISLIILMLSSIAFTQSETNLDSLIIDGKVLLRESFIQWTEVDLLNARAYFERLLITAPDSWLTHYYIGLADFRLVSFCFSQNEQDKALKYIDNGIEHLKNCIQLNENFAEAHNLLSSLYGNKIGVKPLYGMVLGPKAGMAIGKAMSLAPDNPRNYLISGQSAYFTPRMFGGSKKKAKEHYIKAIAYFESNEIENPVLPDWGYEEAYVWLGMVNEHFGENDEALNNYNKALEINPDYGWVSEYLLPKLKNKITTQKD